MNHELNCLDYKCYLSTIKYGFRSSGLIALEAYSIGRQAFWYVQYLYILSSLLCKSFSFVLLFIQFITRSITNILKCPFL